MAVKMEKRAADRGLQALLAAEDGIQRPPRSHPSWVSFQRSAEGAGGKHSRLPPGSRPPPPPTSSLQQHRDQSWKGCAPQRGGEQGAAARAPPAPWNRRYLKRALRLRPPGPGPSSRGGCSPGPRPPAPPRGLWTCTLTFRRSTRGTAGLGRGWQHLTISPRGAPVLGEPRTDTWWAAPGALSRLCFSSFLPSPQRVTAPGWRGATRGPPRPLLAPRRRLRCTGYESGGYCKDRLWSQTCPCPGPTIPSLATCRPHGPLAGRDQAPLGPRHQRESEPGLLEEPEPRAPPSWDLTHFHSGQSICLCELVGVAREPPLVLTRGSWEDPK